MKCLVKLYAKEELVQGLSQFSERIKTRILEMADAEVNHSAQHQAALVAISMSRAGLFEEEDQDHLFSLMFSSDAQVCVKCLVYVFTVYYPDSLSDH